MAYKKLSRQAALALQRTVVRCHGCERAMVNDRGWLPIFLEGISVGFVCTECQTPGQKSANELKESTQGYGLTPDGQVVWLPSGI